MSQVIRSVVVVALGGAALLFAADRVVTSPGFRLPKDFPEYWAAGRVNLRGDNPYDPARLLAEQRLADPARDAAVMMWNPPPSLAAYMPLGLLPARWAALLWVGLQLAAVGLACDLLWRQYGGGRPRWVAALVGLSAVGTWWVVVYGQNAGLLALGLAGYLHFRSRGKPVAAGVCAALTALKPHLLAGFGVLLLADAFTRGGRRALAAGVGVVAVALGLAAAANPGVVGQFAAAVRDPGDGAVPLSGWALPVPSYWLRTAVAPDRFWVQFVPCAVACLVLVAWRVRAGAAWDWRRALPVVVAVSVLTTPYGGWVFDLPVLVVPAVWCAGRLAAAGRSGLLAAFLAGQAGVTAVSLALPPGPLHAYWWVAPAVLALCLLGFLARRP
jgi:hypothetical protein